MERQQRVRGNRFYGADACSWCMGGSHRKQRAIYSANRINGGDTNICVSVDAGRRKKKIGSTADQSKEPIRYRNKYLYTHYMGAERGLQVENKKNDRWIEAASIRDWLDKQIKIQEEQKRSYKFSDSVRCYHPGYEIPIGKGSVYITDLLGLKLLETARDDVEYPFRYEFKYKGVTFYQISKERLLLGEDSNQSDPLANKEIAF